MATRTETGTASKAKKRTPDMATQAKGATHPYIEATPCFLWTYNQDRWTVIAGKLVPSLHKVPLVAACNGVEIDSKGAVRFSRVRARLEDEGRTVIPYDWAPDGESYLQCLDCRPEGKASVQEAWISVFESADVGGTETSSDDEAYADWLDSLVKSGKLPSCTPNLAKRMLDKANERLEKAKADAAKLGGHGQASIRALALQSEVDALTAHVNANKGIKAKAKAKAAPTIVDEVAV